MNFATSLILTVGEDILIKYCSFIFQYLSEPTALEERVDELKKCTLSHGDLQCPEYAFQLVINPWLHPGLNKNIHHLFALISSLCHTCGGVIFLTADHSEINKEVTSEVIEVFKERLTKLISEKIGNIPSNKMGFAEPPLSLRRKTSWIAIHLKKSELSPALTSSCSSNISEVRIKLDGVVRIEERHVKQVAPPDVSCQETMASAEHSTEVDQHVKRGTSSHVSRQENMASAEHATEVNQHVERGTSSDVSRQEIMASAKHSTEVDQHVKRGTPSNVSHQETMPSAEHATEVNQHVERGTSSDVSRQETMASAQHSTEVVQHVKRGTPSNVSHQETIPSAEHSTEVDQHVKRGTPSNVSHQETMPSAEHATEVNQHVERGTSSDVSHQETMASAEHSTEVDQHVKRGTSSNVSHQETLPSAEHATEVDQHVKRGISSYVSHQETMASAGHATEINVKRPSTEKGPSLLGKRSPSSDDATNASVDFSIVGKLDWSKNKKDWEDYVHGETPTLETIVNSCSLWKPTTPMTVTPEKETLGRWFASQEHMEKTLHVVDTKEPGFAVVCKTWKLHILDAETESRPPGHICDILTVSNKATVCLWVICSDYNEQTVGFQMEYLLTTGRMIKYQLVHAAGYGDLSNLCIECRLFCPNKSMETADTVSSAITESLEMQMCIWKLCTDGVKFESLQKAVAWIILLKESPLKRSIGKQTAITLSEQQVQVLHSNHRVNYVSGPAGSGKSYTAALLCQMYGRENSVYICTTEAFVGYLKFSGYNGTLVQKDQDLLREIKGGTFKSKQCIVIDDSHNFTCTKSSMKKLFKLLDDNREMSLYIFADNDYQSFDIKRKQAMENCIRDLSLHVLGKRPHYAYLTTIYRNTKKVASFVQSAIQDSFRDFNKIECQNVEIGDGIECIKMKHVWKDSPRNDLANYIRNITMAETYKLTEIAVLLDPSHTIDQIDKCRSLLKTHIPDRGIQSAEVFPREGVVVDSVTSFLGLDAPLCLFILQKKPSFLKRLFKRRVPKSDARLSNPCFKVFMASRATHRVVFVVSALDVELVKQLKFDVFEVPEELVSSRIRRKCPHPTLEQQ